MLRKLIILILAGVAFWGIFSSDIFAETLEKPTPTKIPLDQIVPSSPMPLTGDKGFCLIQSDNGNIGYAIGYLDAGDRFALYMDPAKCGLPDPYPFKVTDVHFYLYGPGGYTWPVQIQVNIRDLIQGYKCNGPGNLLCSQIYTIPIDSAYPIMIHLDLDSLCCVYAPFFLEIIYTGQPNPPYPSVLMTGRDSNPTDTCDAWFLWHVNGIYYEWYNAWGSQTALGYPVMRITGYTQQCHPESCWYWKADHPNQEFPAPSGMPDFGQYQFGPSDSIGLCGPTAVANCLWWFNAVPPGVKPDSLIRLLSTYFHTHPDSGTYVDSIRSGLNRYFNDYGFSLYAHKFTQPEFYAMEDSLKRSQDIILLLGFWQQPLTEKVSWFRFGGHYVTMAGVCSDSQKVALSDPARDMAEAGLPGRVRPPEHPSHTDGDTLHNHPQYVSQDIYQAILEPLSPGGLWEIDNYYYLPDKMPPPFHGQNFQPEQWQYYHSYMSQPVFTEVEYAIMICPSCWYWKPDTLPQAPSGMPDFDQNQDKWQSYCGPTAVANCLWWFNAVPERWTPPQLIDTLARYFHTDPDSGTYVDSMQIGLEQYFQHYGFALQESTFEMPNFYEMEDSLKKCQDIILLLGFWWTQDGINWFREGGHFVTMAGVCSESLQIAISDPDNDNAESGGAGQIRPPHAQHPADHTLHNNPAFISHDIYNSYLNPQPHSPGNPFWEINYGWGPVKYSGINVPKEFIAVTKAAPKDDVMVVYATEVEYAVMICPKPTAVEEEEEGSITPKDFELYQSYPNPFNNQTLIKYDLFKSCQVTLTIYNILGQKVKTLVNERQEAGSKIVNWGGKNEKGKDLASGIYFYQLKAGEVTQTKRMVLLK